MEITDEMLFKAASRAEELWLSTLPSDDEIPEHRFSRHFERRMQKLIRKQRRSPMLNKFLSTVKRAAVIALVVVTLSFSCLMTVEAYRAKVVEVITEVFHDLTHFSFSSSENVTAELGEIKFNYLPEGMVEIRHDIYTGTQSQALYFEDQNGRYFQFQQQYISDDTSVSLIVDTENADVTTISIDGVDATLVVKLGKSTLIWEEEPYFVVLTGDIAQEEIVKIARELTISR